MNLLLLAVVILLTLWLGMMVGLLFALVRSLRNDPGDDERRRIADRLLSEIEDR